MTTKNDMTALAPGAEEDSSQGIANIRRIVVYEVHDGVKSSNGGEYSYGYTLLPVGGKWRKKYWGGGDFSVCPKCGQHSCDGDICEYEYMADREVREMILNSVFVEKDGDVLVVHPHEPQYCKCGAGCLQCHPYTPHFSGCRR